LQGVCKHVFRALSFFYKEQRLLGSYDLLKIMKRFATMRGWKKIIIGCAVFGLVVSVSSAFAEGEAGKWDTAGGKIMEASHAVGEATEDSALKAKAEADKAVEEARKAWEEAKQKSKETLEAAKKKYEEELEKARAKIHAATAPHDAAQVMPDKDEVSGKPVEK
jgi:transaldolase